MIIGELSNLGRDLYLCTLTYSVTTKTTYEISPIDKWGNPLIPIVVPLLLWPSVAITFQRCKGKSQLSNDLGIRYGLSKIFLSLRVK